MMCMVLPDQTRYFFPWNLLALSGFSLTNASHWNCLWWGRERSSLVRPWYPTARLEWNNCLPQRQQFGQIIAIAKLRIWCCCHCGINTLRNSDSLSASIRNGRKLGQKPVVYSRLCFIYPLAFKSLLFYVPSGHTGFSLKTSPLKQTTKLTKVVLGRAAEM